MVNNGKISLSLNEIFSVSGGSNVGVCPDEHCCKSEGTFEPLDGHPYTKRCRDCWHLKHDSGFYCDC